MSFTADGILNPNEALRLLEYMSVDSGNDFVMMVENKGTVVEGESDRKYADGKKRMEIAGYHLGLEVPISNGEAKSKVRHFPFVVIRDCDAATASIASLLKNQDSDITVQISVFKAGGDVSKDLQPTLEFVLKGVRLGMHAILIGGQPKRPCEIVQFHYREMEIRSAPQLQTGARGAVRTCAFVAGSAA